MTISGSIKVLEGVLTVTPWEIKKNLILWLHLFCSWRLFDKDARRKGANEVIVKVKNKIYKITKLIEKVRFRLMHA